MQKWIYPLLIILSFILYGNSINNDHSFDDQYITSNKYVQKGLAGIPEILTNKYKIEQLNIELDYRPIILISAAIEYQFFKDNAHISHFINVLLYALCLIVLYSVLTTVFKLHTIKYRLPSVIVLFYAIHPVHTEVVDSIKNRDELFGFIFGLLFLKYGFIYFTSIEKRYRFSILAVFFLLLSLLSKIIGILYFPIFILILFYNGLLKWNKWNYIFLISSFILMIFVSGISLYGLERETYSNENSLIGVTDYAVIFSTCFKIIFYHLKMLLLPFPLRFYYGNNMFPLNGVFDPVALLSILLHVTLLITGFVKLIKKDILGLFILCYLVCTFFYSNFPIPYTGMFSERALFLSSLWFIICIAIIILRLSEKLKSDIVSKSIKIILLVVFIIYSFQTIQRNFYWKNISTLYTHDIPTLENSVIANFNYANLLLKESTEKKDSIKSLEIAKKAEKYYKQTLRLYPYYPGYHYQFGRYYRYKLNDTEKAEEQFKNTLQLDERDAGANYELAKIYFEKKDYKKSYVYFEKAYSIKPDDSLTLFYLAQNALLVGEINMCYLVNRQFLNLYPDIKYPYLNLGVYYSTILKDDSAIIYFEKGIALGDRNPDLLKNMVIYFDRKQNKEKVKYYSDLLKSNQ